MQGARIWLPNVEEFLAHDYKTFTHAKVLLIPIKSFLSAG